MIEQFLTEYGEEYKEELEERAAIMEYDGCMSRMAAEAQAVRLLKEKYKMYREGELFS